MKHIIKGAGPRSLHDWIQGQNEAGIAAEFADLQNPEKSDCRSELVREQGALCCYCNRRISAASMHIEHLEAQSVRPDIQTTWTNLLGCCMPQNLKGRKLRTQCHCGEFRGTSRIGVSPSDPACERQFRYSLRGEVKPEPPDNAAAERAIRHLNLGAERLRNSREALIEAAYGDIENLTSAEWMAVYVERQGEECPEFPSMLRWFHDSAWGAEKQALDAGTAPTEDGQA